LDASSGELKWRFETGGDVFSSPAVADGVVYVGSNDKSLYAIDADTGELIWRYEAYDDIGSTPSVVDGIVYFGDINGQIYAVDTTQGEIQWIAHAMPSSFLCLPSPVVYEDLVYFSGKSLLYVFDKETGELSDQNGCMEFLDDIYPFPEIDSNDCSLPTVVDGVIYSGHMSHLNAYFTEDCGLNWSFDTGYLVNSSPAVVQDVVYFVSGDGYLYAVGAESGGLKWKSYIGRNKSVSPFSSPTVADGVVYVGSSNGLVFAMNADTGKTIWLYKTGGPVLSTPAVADGVVYIGSKDGYLYAIEADITNQEDEGNGE
jgi:outer membrane protein assembly factor BamB